MSKSDQIKAELDKLLDDVKPTLELFNDGDHIKAGSKYQIWYTKALQIVKILAADRYDEFREFYEPDPKRKVVDVLTYKIQDWIRGLSAPLDYDKKERFSSKNSATLLFVNQFHVLQSLATRIDGVLANVQGSILADIADAELRAAERLKEISPRAAGALAGVVLEAHLQSVARNHSIAIKKQNPTISDLNDPLKTAGLYDQPAWRKIQFLADVRNLCSHKKGADPTSAQVIELIEGVNWVVKNIS